MLWRCASEAERAGRRKHRQHPQGRVTPDGSGSRPRPETAAAAAAAVSTSELHSRALLRSSPPPLIRAFPSLRVRSPSLPPLWRLDTPWCPPARRRPTVLHLLPPGTVASSYLTASRLLSRRCFSPHSSSMYQRSSNGGGGGGGLYPTSLQHYFTSSPELVTQQPQQSGNIITSVAGSHMWSTGEYAIRKGLSGSDNERPRPRYGHRSAKSEPAGENRPSRRPTIFSRNVIVFLPSTYLPVKRGLGNGRPNRLERFSLKNRSRPRNSREKTQTRWLGTSVHSHRACYARREAHFSNPASVRFPESTARSRAAERDDWTRPCWGVSRTHPEPGCLSESTIPPPRRFRVPRVTDKAGGRSVDLPRNV